MDAISLFFIAVGLAMDAFAVSLASGLTIGNLRIRHALRMAAFFGGFQALMPTVGWLAGLSLKDYIRDYDHWAAFIVLAFIGGKMIYEATLMERAEKEPGMMGMFVLLGLAVATSIDALAVGVTFAFLDITIFTPVLVIGLVTFFMSYSGICIGRRFGSFRKMENKIEIIGGLILIGIGLKILIEHTIFGK